MNVRNHIEIILKRTLKAFFKVKYLLKVGKESTNLSKNLHLAVRWRLQCKLNFRLAEWDSLKFQYHSYRFELIPGTRMIHEIHQGWILDQTFRPKINKFIY